jgi:hypothetical protein
MSRKIVLAAALASADRNILSSQLAWPAFEKRWREGKRPEFPVVGIHL